MTEVSFPQAIYLSASAFRRRRWLRNVAFVVALLTLSVGGATGAVMLFGTRTVHWQAFTADLSMVPATRGRTRLTFVPLGEVLAGTHRAPVELRVSLTGLSFDRMRRLVTSPPPRGQMERDFRRFAREELRAFALRQIILGALGGMLAALVLRAARRRVWWISAAIGAGSVGLLLLGAFRTFDAARFRDPTYTGSLREAHAVIGLARNAFANAGALSDRLRTVAVNLNALYGRIEATGTNWPAESGTIRILHISDIHNNPAAVDFVRELATGFRVAAVIDTGDLTDFGSPIESELGAGLARLPMPYLFVAGNHDSRATVRALARRPNVTVLDGEPVTVAGVTFLGLPDPQSRREGVGDVDTPESAIRAYGERLLASVRARPEPPTIVAVHNPRMARPLLDAAGEAPGESGSGIEAGPAGPPAVPLVLCGHMHRRSLEMDGETVVCNAGTTGAAGVRYLDRKGGVPFTAALITLTNERRPRLLYIDSISLEGTLNEYSIERRTFGARATAPAATAATTP